MALTIPARDRKRLAKLFELSAKELDQISDALTRVPPRLHASQVVDNLISEGVTLESSNLLDIVLLLLTLHWVRSDQGMTPEELVRELRNAVLESDDGAIQTPSSGWEKLEEKLIEMLSLDESLGVTAKALYIAYQFPKHFHAARIFTDLRPVFAEDAAEPPSAFIVMHTLQLTIHDDGEDHEWSLSLNTSDLRELRFAIERALTKERCLKGIMNKTDVPILVWENNGNNDDA